MRPQVGADQLGVGGGVSGVASRGHVLVRQPCHVAITEDRAVGTVASLVSRLLVLQDQHGSMTRRTGASAVTIALPKSRSVLPMGADSSRDIVGGELCGRERESARRRGEGASAWAAVSGLRR